MKIGIDIQALQSAGSKGRGIGRYTEALVEALLRRTSAAQYEFYASRTLSEPSLSMDDLPCRWVNYPVAGGHPANDLLLKTTLLASDVDAVFLPNPMHGADIAMPDFIGFPRKVFALCHDLIPLIFSDHYLRDAATRSAYLKRLDNLRHADLVVTNSEATRQDVIRLLHVPPDQVVTISSGVTPFYRPLTPEERPLWTKTLAEKFGIVRPFVLYTGGDDWRKNMSGLVEAFARLPQTLQNEYQLVIACKLSPQSAQGLAETAARHGFKQSLVLTNYVTDEEMRALYSTCALFVFPPLYEGFGLPLLEAMACGAPAIAANNSSLPEIVGSDDQLFDAGSSDAIAAAVQSGLEDEGWRRCLAERAPRRAALFTWDAVAQGAEEAFLRSHRERPLSGKVSLSFRRITGPAQKPSLAFFSPLRPAKSGISDYSENLLLPLRNHFKIDLYHDGCYQPEKNVARGLFARRTFPHLRFEDGADRQDYEAILYHFGNSEFHTHMYPLLMRYAGITVLHDYHLAGLVNEVTRKPAFGITLQSELVHSYGSGPGQEIARQFDAGEIGMREFQEQGIRINRRIFTRSLGVILHSRWSYEKAVEEFSTDCENITHIPFLAYPVEREVLAGGEIRRRLGVPQDALLISTFGMVSLTKRPYSILKAFQEHSLRNPRVHLVFVGALDPGYADPIQQEIQNLGLQDRVHVVGFVTMGDFCRHIQAADVCLNLRFPFLGETSAALLQILSFGKPVIVTDIGSFSEYPNDVVLKIPPPDAGDEVQEVYQALAALIESAERRERLGRSAADYVAREHSPERCAALYAQFIERTLESDSARQKMLADYVGREAAASPVVGAAPGAWLTPFASTLTRPRPADPHPTLAGK